MAHQFIENNHRKPKKLILIDGWTRFREDLLEKSHFFEAFFDSEELSNNNENNMWLDVFWSRISNRMRLLIEYKPHTLDQNTILIKAETYPKHYVPNDSSTNGWSEFIGTSLKTYLVSGDHNTMMEAPNLQKLAKILISKT